MEEKYDINSKFIVNGFFEQTRLFLDNLEAPNFWALGSNLGVPYGWYCNLCYTFIFTTCPAPPN